MFCFCCPGEDAGKETVTYHTVHWPPAPPEEKVPAGHRTKEAVPLQRYPAGHAAGAVLRSPHTAPGGHAPLQLALVEPTARPKRPACQHANITKVTARTACSAFTASQDPSLSLPAQNGTPHIVTRCESPSATHSCREGERKGSGGMGGHGRALTGHGVHCEAPAFEYVPGPHKRPDRRVAFVPDGHTNPAGQGLLQVLVVAPTATP